MPLSSTLWNVPNLLTLSRLPLSALLFACIAQSWWLPSLAVFTVASVTDWLDGWWARRFRQLTDFGRTFDPLIDKVMVGGAFIYLMMVPAAGLVPWMVTVVIGRELLITGIRGYIEAMGKKFGADWFGKLKMVLQCVVLFVVFIAMTCREQGWLTEQLDRLESLQTILIYLMLAATIGSGLQYCRRAAKLAGEA